MNCSNYNISVIIPAFNSASTIIRAINSVLCQTVQLTEIIIVDDGSTDQTLSTINDLKVSCAVSIKVISITNSGPGNARNIASEHAQGEWLAFIDSDDVWLPDKIQRQIELLNTNPTVEICYSNYYTGNNKNKELHNTGINNSSKLISNTNISDYFTLLKKGFFALTSTVLVKKSLFDQSGKFALYRAGEDTDLWCRIGLLGVPVLYDNTPLTIYSEDSPKNFARRLYLPERITQLNSLYQLAVDKGKEREFFPVARILTLEAINQLKYQKRYSEVAGFLDDLNLPFTRRFILEEKLKAGSPHIMGNIIPAYHKIKNMFR